MPISSVNRKTHFYNRLSFGWERFEKLSQKNNSDLAESLTAVQIGIPTVSTTEMALSQHLFSCESVSSEKSKVIDRTQ